MLERCGLNSGSFLIVLSHCLAVLECKPVPFYYNFKENRSTRYCTSLLAQFSLFPLCPISAANHTSRLQSIGVTIHFISNWCEESCFPFQNISSHLQNSKNRSLAVWPALRWGHFPPPSYLLFSSYLPASENGLKHIDQVATRKQEVKVGYECSAISSFP